jgi:hypothetical protein
MLNVGIEFLQPPIESISRFCQGRSNGLVRGRRFRFR